MNQVEREICTIIAGSLRYCSDQGLPLFRKGQPQRLSCLECEPDFEMLATFAGIQPQVPGFKKVVIHPMMQKLDKVNGSIPHWAGKLEVSFEKKDKQLRDLSYYLRDNRRLEWEIKS